MSINFCYSIGPKPFNKHTPSGDFDYVKKPKTGTHQKKKKKKKRLLQWGLRICKQNPASWW
jgi:hypothetical protein